MAERNILETILEHKRSEVDARRALRSVEEMEERIDDGAPPLDFLWALCFPKGGPTALIAEVKKASPSAGVIREAFDPVAIARIYEAHGADCLSVLTDERFFQGHDDYLKAVRSAVGLPILRKEFVVDPYQIYEARLLGADAVLLIAAALTRGEMERYSDVAHELGLAALVEVHTEGEMESALAVGAKLIGINNRDLTTFITDLGTVDRLARMVPSDVTLVAESGIKSAGDVARVRAGGAHAILVGETLMRAPDIGAALDSLRQEEQPAS